MVAFETIALQCVIVLTTAELAAANAAEIRARLPLSLNHAAMEVVPSFEQVNRTQVRSPARRAGAVGSRGPTGRNRRRALSKHAEAARPKESARATPRQGTTSLRASPAPWDWCPARSGRAPSRPSARKRARGQHVLLGVGAARRRTWSDGKCADHIVRRVQPLPVRSSMYRITASTEVAPSTIRPTSKASPRSA